MIDHKYSESDWTLVQILTEALSKVFPFLVFIVFWYFIEFEERKETFIFSSEIMTNISLLFDTTKFILAQFKKNVTIV